MSEDGKRLIINESGRVDPPGTATDLAGATAKLYVGGSGKFDPSIGGATGSVTLENNFTIGSSPASFQEYTITAAGYRNVDLSVIGGKVDIVFCLKSGRKIRKTAEEWNRMLEGF